MATTKGWCIWCTGAPAREEYFNEYCSKDCFSTHKADPCSLCKVNPGRVFWELGSFICTGCCQKELLRVQEEFAKIRYIENRLKGC